MSDKRPTYAEQEKHLHEQYIAGLVRPMDCEFCFCGNLLGDRFTEEELPIYNDSRHIHWPIKLYTLDNLCSMEDVLFSSLGQIAWEQTPYVWETALFNGMVAALEVLKEIHRSWGEQVDGPVKFERREYAS